MEAVEIDQVDIENAKHTFLEVGSAVKTKAAKAADRVISRSSKVSRGAKEKSNGVIEYVENKVDEGYNWVRRSVGMEEVHLQFNETRQVSLDPG